MEEEDAEGQAAMTVGVSAWTVQKIWARTSRVASRGLLEGCERVEEDSRFRGGGER